MHRQHWVSDQGPLLVAVVLGSENHLFKPLHKNRRAPYPQGAAVEPMRVEHGGAHSLVAEMILDDADDLG